MYTMKEKELENNILKELENVPSDYLSNHNVDSSYKEDYMDSQKYKENVCGTSCNTENIDKCDSDSNDKIDD